VCYAGGEYSVPKNSLAQTRRTTASDPAYGDNPS